MRRMDPKWIEDDCLFRPQFQSWPPPQHRAVLWTLATYVTFRLGHEKGTMGELRDYIKEHMWKLYHQKDTGDICDVPFGPGKGNHGGTT
jgi:hypothetical protein